MQNLKIYVRKCKIKINNDNNGLHLINLYVQTNMIIYSFDRKR